VFLFRQNKESEILAGKLLIFNSKRNEQIIINPINKKLFEQKIYYLFEILKI